MMSDNRIVPLNIKALLSESKYMIPIYQRNYDWGEKETLQLIEDISDYVSDKKGKKYYIGSLVVLSRYKDGEQFFETIDGQQRLTTLTIMMIALRSFPECSKKLEWFLRPNVFYDHRPEADEALRRIGIDTSFDALQSTSIYDVYQIILKHLPGILNKKGIGNVCDFVDYLLENVIIMRIPVPHDTDLNHYFEIMNSRGEQLEKHEVLKASLMNCLPVEDHVLFDRIWDACSNMNTYLQMNFAPALRSLIFTTDWDSFRDDCSFDELLDGFNNLDEDTYDGDFVKRSLADLISDSEKNISYPLPSDDSKGEIAGDRFGTVVNFPNFLLHVLKVMYRTDPEYDKDVFDEIRLDDKRLLDIFKVVLNSSHDQTAFVKRYIMNLLKFRYRFDKYVIKREYYNGKEGWSLKMVKKYDKSKVNYVGTFGGDEGEDDVMNRDIRMLEAMFHVSAPTPIYKHWLNAILYYLDIHEKFSALDFRDFLYNLACAYMTDRYLTEECVPFEDIIYENDFKGQNRDLDFDLMDNGCCVENFIFNFYDYLLWKGNTSKYARFEFTYRTSVEHFYPQHPMMGYRQLTKEDGLHCFGNLCLISRGMNSRFGNNMPVAKCENFGNEIVANELSLKLLQMMEYTKIQGDWKQDEILQFRDRARREIRIALNL